MDRCEDRQVGPETDHGDDIAMTAISFAIPRLGIKSPELESFSRALTGRMMVTFTAGG